MVERWSANSHDGNYCGSGGNYDGGNDTTATTTTATATAPATTTTATNTTTFFLLLPPPPPPIFPLYLFFVGGFPFPSVLPFYPLVSSSFSVSTTSFLFSHSLPTSRPPPLSHSTSLYPLLTPLPHPLIHLTLNASFISILLYPCLWLLPHSPPLSFLLSIFISIGILPALALFFLPSSRVSFSFPLTCSFSYSACLHPLLSPHGLSFSVPQYSHLPCRHSFFLLSLCNSLYFLTCLPSYSFPASLLFPPRHTCHISLCSSFTVLPFALFPYLVVPSPHLVLPFHYLTTSFP